MGRVRPSDKACAVRWQSIAAKHRVATTAAARTDEDINGTDEDENETDLIVTLA